MHQVVIIVEPLRFVMVIVTCATTVATAWDARKFLFVGIVEKGVHFNERPFFICGLLAKHRGDRHKYFLFQHERASISGVILRAAKRTMFSRVC